MPIADRDHVLLFSTRIVRLFGYGFLALVLVLYLEASGLTATQGGIVLSLTLAGDAVLSVLLAAYADRIGRRRTLMIGALLMFAAGVAFALTNDFALLVLAAAIGVVSPSGGEVGPFLPIEQVSLAETLPAARRTAVFAWYNVAGSLATAAGALAAGAGVEFLLRSGSAALDAYRVVVMAYAGLGLVLLTLFALLSPRVELAHGTATARPSFSGRSRRVVTRLAMLFALDAFAGGFVVQSIVAYWFHLRFGASLIELGRLFFAANLLAGFSALAAAAIARRIGLLNTMVFTHLPSNVLLMLVPLMPSFGWAVALLLMRFAISQMDVPTRQAYVIAAVEPHERTGAAGVTAVARTVGAALAPALATPLVAAAGAAASIPFFAAGALKIVYDVALLVAMRRDD